MASTPRLLTPNDPIPPHGSVVMVHGLEGTAYQRFYQDGLFYCGGPKAVKGPLLYSELFDQLDPRVYLVYETPEHVEDYE